MFESFLFWILSDGIDSSALSLYAFPAVLRRGTYSLRGSADPKILTQCVELFSPFRHCRPVSSCVNITRLSGSIPDTYPTPTSYRLPTYENEIYRDTVDAAKEYIKHAFAGSEITITYRHYRPPANQGVGSHLGRMEEILKDLAETTSILGPVGHKEHQEEDSGTKEEGDVTKYSRPIPKDPLISLHGIHQSALTQFIDKALKNPSKLVVNHLGFR